MAREATERAPLKISGQGKPTMKIAEMIDLAAALNTKRQDAYQAQSVFDRSVGVDDNCFSATQLVNALVEGVEPDERRHLLSCTTCLENVSGLAEVELQPGLNLVVDALKATSNAGREVSKPKQLAREKQFKAILAFPSRRIEAGKVFTLSCEVIPAFNREMLKRIDRRSIRFEGAVTDKNPEISEPIDVNNDGTPDFLRVTLKNGALSRRVREGIDRHQQVIDTIQMKGRFVNNPTNSVVGQAILTFF